jgi:hypothetical protein
MNLLAAVVVEVDFEMTDLFNISNADVALISL